MQRHIRGKHKGNRLRICPCDIPNKIYKKYVKMCYQVLEDGNWMCMPGSTKKSIRQTSIKDFFTPRKRSFDDGMEEELSELKIDEETRDESSINTSSGSDEQSEDEVMVVLRQVVKGGEKTGSDANQNEDSEGKTGGNEAEVRSDIDLPHANGRIAQGEIDVIKELGLEDLPSVVIYPPDAISDMDDEFNSERSDQIGKVQGMYV